MTCNERRIIINCLRSEGFDDLVEAGDGIDAPGNMEGVANWSSLMGTCLIWMA